MGVYEFHIPLDELMEMMIGDIIDLINLLAVYNGSAKEHHTMTFDEVLKLR